MPRPAAPRAPAAAGKPETPHATGAQVSIAAVAQRAGVSIATVSRVVNGVSNKASPATAQRVREAVAALGYRPTGAGRSLRSGRSRLVAVLAANLANPSMAAIAASAETALRDAGYVMVLCDTHDRPQLQDEYLLEMRAQYACGIVLLAAVDSPGLRRLATAGDVPVVFVNRRNPGGGGRHVGIDNAAAGAEVARWFAQQGWRRIGLIHGRLASSATAERVQGFVAEARRAGLLLPRGRQITTPAPEHLEIGHQAMGRLLAAAHAPQAVFCTSDLIAYGARRRLEEAGRAAEVQLVGFDDGPLNAWVAPWLSAVRVPYAEYGRAIVQALAGEVVERVLPHRLVLRRCAACATPA